MKRSFRFKLIIIFCLVFVSALVTPSYSQKANQLTLTGRVVNGEGKGMSYTAVALLNEEHKIVSYCFCEEDGTFNLPKVSAGKYTLELSLTGCTPRKYPIELDGTKTCIGDFLMEEGVELGRVVVSAERKLVKTEVNKLIYEVEKDPDAKNASTMQILNKVPFVEVDKISGKIKVLGEENGFSILVNGKKSLLLSESNQYVAKALEADRLKNIELITSPDGKYYNQTAVLNFVTKTSLPDGFVCDLSMYGNNDDVFGSGLNLTSKFGKFIYNLKYQYGYSDKYGSETSMNVIDYRSKDFRFMDSYSRNSPGASNDHNVSVNVSCDMSKYDLIAVKFNTSISDSRSEITSHSQYMSSENIVTREFKGQTLNNASGETYVGGISYQRSFKENPAKMITASYGVDNRRNEMKYDQITEALTGYTDNRDVMMNNLDNIEHTLAVDFYNPVSSKHSYYLTTKYVNRNYGSDTWLTDKDVNPEQMSLLDNLSYKQQVGSLQGNYSYKNNNIMLTADIAYEHTRNNIDFRLTNTSLMKNDDALLFNLRFTYRPTKRSTFILSLKRNSFRPDITYLNPYEDKSIPGQVIKGNPNLNSQKEYFPMLMHTYFIDRKLSLRSIVSMRFSNNAVQKYSYIDNNGTLVSTYSNISKNRMYLFNFGGRYTPVSWLSIDLSGRIAYLDFEYPGNSNSYWDPLVMLSAQSGLWKGATFEMQMQYADPNTSKSYNIQSKKQHLIMSGMFSFTQKLGRHLDISVRAVNPWERYTKSRFEDMTDDLYRYQQEKRLGRTVSLAFTYNFGKFNDVVKSTKRTIQNTDRTKD